MDNLKWMHSQWMALLDAEREGRTEDAKYHRKAWEACRMRDAIETAASDLETGQISSVGQYRIAEMLRRSLVTDEQG